MPPQEPRVCLNCSCTTTPLWRRSPLGPKTLCNACGVRMKKGRLLFSDTAPHFRPVESATALAKRLRREQAASRANNPPPHRDKTTVLATAAATAAVATAVTAAPEPANLPRLPPLPPLAPPSVDPSASAPTSASAHAHATARAAIAKSSARRKVKAFGGSAAGLYYLLAAIEFIETS